MTDIAPIPPDFDGCARSCRKTRTHTLLWGDCAHAPESARPEPRINIGPRAYLDTDGEMSLGYDTYTVTEFAERVETALRTVPITLGPNARAMLERGDPVRLSGGEYSAMALAVAMDLADEGQP